MSFAHMLADVEKLVLLHDDGLIPRLVASHLSQPILSVWCAPRFIREPSGVLTDSIPLFALLAITF
jgi:hypothetical protein